MTAWLARLTLSAILILAGFWFWHAYTERTLSASSILERCEGTGQPKTGRECYEQELKSLLQVKGAEEALTRLAELEKENGTVRANCHGMAHTLGQAGYEQYGSIRQALGHGQFDCSSGYYHGVIERGLQDVVDVAPAILAACEGIGGGDGEFLFHWCNHGLGHGLAAYRQYDIGQALGDCNLLTTSWRRDSCWGGVFMENIDAKFVHQFGYNPQGPLQDDGTDFWPCLSVGEEFRPACFRIITARILPKHGRDFAYTARACDGLGNPSYTLLCYESYGRDAGGEGLHTELGRVHQLCAYASDTMRDTCYRAVAETVVAHFADPKRVDDVCRDAGESRSACEAGKNRIAQSLAG